MTDYSLTPEQRAENVRAVASTAAAAIRFLNNATLSPGDAALESPADVDAVLAELESMAGRLPQLLGQLGGWLAAECAAGRLRVTPHLWERSPSTEALAVSAARQYFTEATVHAEALREVLHDARQITAAIVAPAGSEEEL